jgi:hypothetical protein
MRSKQKTLGGTSKGGANYAWSYHFRLKASHGVVASRFAALAAVLETPGTRTAVGPDAPAQVSRAELQPE